MHIDLDNLRDAQGDQAGKFAWYAVVAANAASKLESAKNRLEILKAEKGSEFRKNPSAGKVTEGLVNEHVTTHPEVIEMEKEVVEARRQLGLVKAAEQAFIHRRDMLIQLGASERLERKEY